MYIFYAMLFGLYLYRKNLGSYISKTILKIIGYKFEEIDINTLPSKIVMIGSHTSIYDFLIGLLYYYAVLHKRYNTYILMKKQFEIFCTPILSFIDNKFNLISIDKTLQKTGLTTKICATLKNKDDYLLFIAPEGTRKCTETLRSGYWYIAQNLDIDIIYFGIDFSAKTIVLEKSRKTKDTWEEEQMEFINSCQKYVPLYPERCYWMQNYY